jgi:aldose 1-epimerase
MQRNENGVTTLHSGDHGLHALDWHVIEQHQNRVVFECTLNAGACGLPGNRIISAEYSLDQDGLQLKITATTDAQTPINIAHHPYWVLGDDLAKMRIKIAAQHYLPVGPDNLPLGTVNPVADTTFDFQNLRQIGPASALDHNFCLNQTSRNAPSFAARLSAPDGLTLDVETTEPGLQVYAGSSLPNLPKTATFGTQSRPNAAIALEPQGWPNAPNNNNFPNVFIDENDVYQQVTRYRIYQAN